MRWDAPHRRAHWQTAAHFGDHRIAHFAAAAQDHTAKAGINRAQPRRDQRVLKRIRLIIIGRIIAHLAHAASPSSARSMRTVDPVSSSTLRRNRWRSAIGATVRI